MDSVREPWEMTLEQIVEYRRDLCRRLVEDVEAVLDHLPSRSMEDLADSLETSARSLRAVYDLIHPAVRPVVGGARVGGVEPF